MNTKKNRSIFLLSLIVSVTWVLGKTINVYKYAVVGAFFEAAWLPVMASLFLLAVLSLIYWTRDRLSLRSLNLYSLLLLISTFLFTRYHT